MHGVNALLTMEGAALPAFIRIILVVLALGGLSQGAAGEVVQRVKFAQAPVIIVWSGDSAPVSGTQVTVSSAATQAQPVSVRTGRLEPVITGLDPFSERTSKRFRVASNVPFAIRAQVAPGGVAQSVRFHFALSDVGENAQMPGGGGLAEHLTLGDLSAPTTIYRSGRKTAARAGSVASQSLEFEADWTGAQAASVIFTVYIPGDQPPH